MADRNLFPFQIVAPDPSRVGIFGGSWAPQNTSAPATFRGKGSTAARTSGGLYTVTMTPRFEQANAIIPFLQLSTPAARMTQIGLVDASARTFQIRVLDMSGNVQDIAANANNRMGYIACLKQPRDGALFEVKTLGRNRLYYFGSFGTNGSGSALTLSGTEFSVTRSATGTYTITLNSIGYSLQSFIPALQLAAADDKYAQGGIVSASAGTAIARIWDISGGAEADVASNTNNRIHFMAVLKLAGSEA